MDEIETAYYLRLSAADKPGVLADVTRIIADRGISIEAVLQKEPANESELATIIMLTHRVIEGRMNEALQKIEALPTITGPVVRIRLEHLAK
jgi:homoserine dehydrogenase